MHQGDIMSKVPTVLVLALSGAFKSFTMETADRKEPAQ